MAVGDYSTTASSNSTVGGVSIAEGMSPANVNDAIRGLMADIAQGIIDGDFATVTDKQPLDATLTALAGLATGANKLAYSTGTDTFAQTDLTAYARTLLALSSKSAVQTELGAITVTAASLANPGYLKINVSGTDFMLQWGRSSIAANSTGSISYPQSYSSWAACIVSGGGSSPSNEGDVHGYSNSGLSSQAIVNTAPVTGYYTWISVGV